MATRVASKSASRWAQLADDTTVRLWLRWGLVLCIAMSASTAHAQERWLMLSGDRSGVDEATLTTFEQLLREEIRSRTRATFV